MVVSRLPNGAETLPSDPDERLAGVAAAVAPVMTLQAAAASVERVFSVIRVRDVRAVRRVVAGVSVRSMWRLDVTFRVPDSSKESKQSPQVRRCIG